ncbi:XPG domain containing-domain-containing protein [Elsinoe ampelina]|uniref:XPG domain containing-domain-containing protein n=1 Tax=Elsinoe ampelina TaxID=302913 RepID=A0A6A6GIM7_9PEZI|nr:XPG domain containing-domain-containing protein [Elsinoe ampelina]
MGIPGLTRKAEEHAERVILERDSLKRRQAILDGPALAYHVLNLCISQREERESPFDDVPTYEELARSTVQWLKLLSKYGFEIAAIVFDGYLPSWKKFERSSRGQQSLNRLVKFRASRNDHQLGRIGPPSVGLFDPSVALSETKLEQIAAPPCFINAVLDSLFNNDYGAVTKVVPGEADSYCAEIARCHEAAFIFTSDSDLLVQDLGDTGKVVIFKDVSFDTTANLWVELLVHHPSRLAELLQVPNLIATAYCVKQNFRRSLSEAAAMVRMQNPTGSGYEEFRKLYTSHGEQSTMMKYLQTTQYKDVVCFLEEQDPRVSELVLQLQIRPGNDTTVKSERSIYFFLPFLLEDPSKSSAFQPSTGLLKLCYSILKYIDKDLGYVTEYTRRGLAIQSAALMLHPIGQTDSEIRDTGNWLEDALTTCDHLPVAARWRMLAAAILLDHQTQSGKGLPSRDDMIALVLNSSWPPWTWALLHAKAQMQGILFSLRLIKQIVSFTILVNMHVSLGENASRDLRRLDRVLASLPKTSDVLDWKDGTSAMSMAEIQTTVNMIDKLTTSPEDDALDGGFEKLQGKGKKKKGKRQTKVQAKAASSQPAIQGKNQYSLLADL